jgi:hypothetical protein
MWKRLTEQQKQDVRRAYERDFQGKSADNAQCQRAFLHYICEMQFWTGNRSGMYGVAFDDLVEYARCEMFNEKEVC